MRKTELLEIGCLEATKKMLKFSKKEEKKSRKQRLQKKKKMRKFEYEVSVKICKKGEILAVSFFRIKEMLAGQVQPEIVVFLNKKERTYLSYLPREAKWRTATIIKIMGYFYGSFYHCTKRDWALFRKYFDTECSRWTSLKVSSIRSIIEEFQTDILWDRIEERRRQETNEWDQVISGIKYTDIDYENRTLKIERQLGRSLEVDENEIAPKTRTKQEIDVKTPASNRVEKIPNFLFSEILEERKKYEKNRSRRQHGRWVFQDMDYICCSSYGRPRSTTYIYTHYKKLIEEAGLPYIRFHDLRHTYTTLLMKNDINQKAIAASLGHSKSIITFDVYTDKQALIEGGVEEIDAFIDEVHPYDSEDIQILKEKYGKKVLHRLA